MQARTATSATRPLAYQSPWVVNASFGYAPEARPFSAYLFYRVNGPYIQEVGSNFLPDSYQQEFHQLDFALTWSLTDDVQLTGRIRNLLNDRSELLQDDVVIRAFDPGVSGSISLTWTH